MIRNKKNIDYLKKNFPLFYQEIELSITDNDFFSVENTAHINIPYISYIKNSLQLRLNSKNNPVRELQRILEQENSLCKYDSFIFADFFGGYESELINQLLNKNTNVCYIIFFPELFYKIIKNYDITFLQNYSVSFIFAKNIEFLQISLNNYLKKFPNSKFISRNNTAKVIKYEKPEFTVISEYIERNSISKNTLGKFEELYKKNIGENMKIIGNLNTINEIKKKYLEKPPKYGILIGAGPSADLYCRQIENFRYKSIVIAVDAAVPILAHNKITADFIITVDPQPECEKFFHSDFSNSALIFSLYAQPSVIKKYNGKKYYFVSTMHPALAQFYDHLKFAKNAELAGGSSVSVYALDFLIYIGVNNIIFIGQDFGFTNNLIYAKTSDYYNNLYANMDKFSTLETNFYQYIIDKHAIKCDGIYTLHNLKNYMIEFEYYISKTGINFYNLNPKGISVRGSKTIGLFEDLQIDNFD